MPDSTQSAAGSELSSISDVPSVGEVVQVIEWTKLPNESLRFTIPFEFFMQKPQDPPSPFLASTI